MRQAVGLVVAVALLGVTGCATNEYKQTILTTMTQMEEATAKMNALRSTMSSTLRKVEGEAGKDKQVSKDDLKPVLDKAKDLKEVGSRMAELHARAQDLAAKLKAEEKAELRKEYEPQLESQVAALLKARRALDEATPELLARCNEAARDALKDSLESSLQEFEGITRR